MTVESVKELSNVLLFLYSKQPSYRVEEYGCGEIVDNCVACVHAHLKVWSFTCEGKEKFRVLMSLFYDENCGLTDVEWFKQRRKCYSFPAQTLPVDNGMHIFGEQDFDSIDQVLAIVNRDFVEELLQWGVDNSECEYYLRSICQEIINTYNTIT